MKQKPKAKPQGSKGKNTKPKAGLSFSEKKRLKELQRTLAGNHKEQEKPTTAQNTITFKKMFRDGICQVTSEFYTKMVEFYDINYDLLEIEDQGEILEEYSKLINYFDPSIRFELFLFNRQVNEQTLIDQFDIPLQGDDFDDIREEYTEMLKKQAAKGNNGIIKSKYLIFGTECKGYKEAKSKLNNIEKDVIKNFLNLGTHAKSLDGKERLRILQNKAEKARKKTEAARKKIPKKKEYSFERVFDEKTGKAKYVLTAVEKEKQLKPDSPVKMVAGRVGAEYSNSAHGKVAEVEKENSAVEGAHKTEQTAEDVYHFVKRNHKSGLQRKKEKVAKLEKKQFKKEVNFRYQKFLEENPEMQEKTLKKQMQKRLQKQRIKREYAKARRAGQAAKNTKEAAAKSANFITKVAKKIQEIASRNVSLLVTIGIFALLLIMIMTAISSCGAMFSDGMSTTLAGSYMSVPAEIDAADLAFSELEMELQKEINDIETDYPDYDEYRYNLDAIGHDPFVLISYLSAVHTEFTASEVQSEIESLFEEMYELTLNPTTETRTRTVTKTGTRTVTDPITGEEEYEYEEEEEYTVTILEVTLTATDLGVVVAGHMNEEQKEIYALYNETHGLTQQFYTPLNLYWYSYVSSYYGYRINPVTGQEQFHRGVDIAVPTGTTVLAAMDGTVTTATYDASYGNYVVIEDSNGYCTKYAHMDTLNVSAGQTVTHGTTIGTTGNTGSSTGSHLHIECLYNGEYYNPLFYFDVGEGTLYGETPGGGGSPGNVIPPDSYDDVTVQALMEEAARYLGYPYVWGGSSPSTSFDCSGFVCWVFTNSGVHNLPRTTAQGIYDQCTPVSAADAKAGDIIFFTGTYNSPGPVSHVGIYCGNGVMIHCGDPIKYASINTPYWQSHFYSFGRLS